MQIPSRRLALTAIALVILGAVGRGAVSAAAEPTGTPPAVLTGTPDDEAMLDDIILAADPTTPDGAGGDRLDRLRERLGRRAGALRGRLVHGTITVVGKDDQLVTLQLDRGTVSATGDGTITIAERGGGSVTVATTDATRVRKAKAPATLADIDVGATIIVVSDLDGGAATARRIVIPPPVPTPSATPGSGATP